MSVIQRIQEKQKWVFGTIALALVLFIVQDAVMNKGKGMFSNSSTIGKVNGVAIDRNEYEHKISLYEQFNNAQRDQIMPELWNMMVQQTLLQQEFDKLGLKVTTKELSDVLFGDNPPSWMTQAFTDPSTGVYNVDAARQQFSQMKKNASDPKIAQLYEVYLEPTMLQSLAQKYQAMISEAAYVPKWYAEKTNADNNAMAKISYASVPYNTISDSTIKVSDDEITAYMKKHSKQFEQKEETRQIEYVSFDASPSKLDSNAVVSQLNQLKSEFASTTDVKSFLSRNSSDMDFFDSYLGKSAIKQQQKDSLCALPKGAIYGPYLDNNDYVLAKMIDIKQMPDSVKVRHILVTTQQRDDSSALHRLDSAIALINSGVNFDSVCAKYSDDPGSKDKGGVYDYFPSGQMATEFNDFAFGGKTGDKGTVKTSYGYHYIEILGQKGSEPGYKIAYLAKPITASPETVDAANTAANKFAATSKTQSQFEANAKKLNLTPSFSQDINKNDNNVPGLGDSRQLVRWVYDKDLGDISDPTEVGDKYIVAMIVSINKSGLQNVNVVRPTLEPIIRNLKKAQIIIDTKIKGSTLEEIAKSAASSVQVADSISFQSYIINGIGNEPKVLGAAFNKQLQGKVSTAIAGNTGVFVVKGESIFASSSLGSNPTTTKQQLENQLKMQAGNFNALVASLKEAADIQDYRSDFY